MINASSEFIRKLNDDTGVCVNYADIILSDGTELNLDYTDFMVTGNSITDKVTSGKFSVGNVMGKTCALTIANHDERFSEYDFYMAIVYLYVAMQLDDGTIEKIRKGKYYITSPATTGEVITIQGVDSINLFDRDYDSGLAYPATLLEIVTDCCLQCGVRMPNNFLFPNYILVANERPQTATYRQVLTWVAEIACGYFRVDENDYLSFITYKQDETVKNIIDGGNSYNKINEEIIDGGNFTDYEADLIFDGGDFFDYTEDDGNTHITKVKTLTVSTDDVRITGVKLITKDKQEFVEGTEDYCLIVKENIFAKGNEQFIVRYLFDTLSKFVFRPLEAQIRNNPLIQPCDTVYVHDRKGNQYFALINSVSYSTSGYTTISCKAENPVSNKTSFYSPQVADIISVRRETEQKLSIYEKAVQSMNMLAANSMGVFTSEEVLEDGSSIHYMHDKPSREESMVIYKMTADGFFISQDGGETYTAGFDAEGNAVLNVLSVIGITFDWARGGVLSLGGDNNLNGQIYIYDYKGDLCGVMNNAGLAIYSELNGKQVIISPTLGYVERDAEDGTFAGQVADITTHFDPVYDSPEGKTIYEASYINYQHKDSLIAEVTNTKNEQIMAGVSFTYYKWKYYYQHDTGYWKEDNPVVFKPTYETVVQLPDNFKGQNFSVSVSSAYNMDRYEERKDDFVRRTMYNGRIDSEKADGTEWYSKDWYMAYASDPMWTQAVNYPGTTRDVDVPVEGYIYTPIKVSAREKAKLTLTYSIDYENATISIETTDNRDADLFDIRVLAMY